MGRRMIVGIVAVILGLGLWMVLRSPYRNVTNLGAPGKAVVVLGDSIVAGYPVGPDIAWPAVVQKDLQVPFVNAGKSGDTTTGALDRIDPDVLSQHPRLVIVELGGNDFLQQTDPEVTRRNLETIFQKIQSRGAMVMFVGMMTPFKPEYQSVFEETCQKMHVFYVPNALQDVVAHPELMADQIHPNAAGHLKLAARLGPIIHGLLKAGDAAGGGR